MFQRSIFLTRRSLAPGRFGSQVNQKPKLLVNAVFSRGVFQRRFFQQGTVEEEGPLTERIREFLPPDRFYDLLKRKGMEFYAGVPDSLLADFCAYVADHAPKEKHVITVNEGAAIALACGHHLATGKFPVVYMQNSGFGNAINPLLSLTDAKVYAVPMLLLIGWRGEPGKKDEPQHLVQGKVMSALLHDLNIQSEVLPDFEEGAEEAIDAAVHHMNSRKSPYAFLVKRQTFVKYKLTKKEPNPYTMKREQALDIVTSNCGPWDVLVGTTGFTSRELFELRVRRGEDHSRDFLTVGSMGHASAIALGVALAKPSRQVICLDGDGAMLMHMGNLCTVAGTNPTNFKHVLINNGCHDSVGGQSTKAFNIDFLAIARGVGYKWARTVENEADLVNAVKELRDVAGPAFLEVRCARGARANLGRPTTSPVQNKEQFMKFLHN